MPVVPNTNIDIVTGNFIGKIAYTHILKGKNFVLLEVARFYCLLHLLQIVLIDLCPHNNTLD